MKRMTVNVLKRLENIQSNIQIAIYLPLLNGPENTAKNVSTLHHALALLKKTFDDAFVPKANQQSISQHINELEHILAHPMPGKSLAIFITDTNSMLAYEVPFATETAIYFMAPNMQLEPLKQHYHDTAVYWVLSLSQKGCHLFRGIDDELHEVDARDIAVDMKTALRLDELNNPETHAHSVGSGTSKEGFHGHGGFRDIKKRYLQSYLRIIDKRLSKYIHADQSPVILLGVERTQSMYRKVSNRKHIMSSKISYGSMPVSRVAIRYAVMPLLPKSTNS